MSLKKFSSKDPTESIILSFDYTDVIPDLSETIVSAQWDISVLVGTDPAASSVLSGQRGISGKVVSVLSTAGLDNCDYVITCLVDTDKNQGILASGLLQVRNQV